MKKILFCLLVLFNLTQAQETIVETMEQKDSRMKWWREARFGMFIHWGLYSIPAGEWNGNTNHAEWIRTTAEIPLEEYDKFVHQFNPVKFNADEWVRAAKNAGMKYIVITSKHHDGFCLFDSEHTDFDIMSTPFKRDILKELADACRKEGLKMCFYHSIMDWHHPDYLPRRSWETSRSSDGADFKKYIQYLKNQLKEIVTRYGDIGVLWFDGEWEDSWTKELGDELYNYVRSLDKNIIVNNRVSKAREGMAGLSVEGKGAGDFGTPEQEIPETGLSGIDWESCITMNNNWGYNKHDKNWKSTKYILQMLSDIASKGGNLLLNVGPTSEGLFPQESIERLEQVGKWMKINGEAIYGTTASPFKNLTWGKCTQKQLNNNTLLYLHVFDYPKDGKLFLPGVLNSTEQAYLLSEKTKELITHREEDGIVINLPPGTEENIIVVALEIMGKPQIVEPPVIDTDPNVFINRHNLKISSDYKDYEIRYTLDGSIPNASSSLYDAEIAITKSTVVSARLFKDNTPVSASSKAEFKKVEPVPSINMNNLEEGILYKYYEGDWDSLPDFSSLKNLSEGVLTDISIEPRKSKEKYGFEYSGYLKVDKDDVYTFYVQSDDGSRLFIGDRMLVDNDGLHSMDEKMGIVALQAGLHPFRLIYFQKSGGDGLKVLYKAFGKEKEIIPGSMLFHQKNKY